MKRYGSYTESFRKRITSRVADGESVISVSHKYGVPEATIRGWCRKHGVSLNPIEKISDETWAKIIPLMGKRSDYKLSRDFGIASSSICTKRNELGIASYGRKTNPRKPSALSVWKRSDELREYIAGLA